MRVFENRVLRRIFAIKRDEVAGGWKNCIRSFVKSIQNNILVIKSRKMILANM
jgi:hypothetical protein